MLPAIAEIEYGLAITLVIVAAVYIAINFGGAIMARRVFKVGRKGQAVVLLFLNGFLLYPFAFHIITHKGRLIHMRIENAKFQLQEYSVALKTYAADCGQLPSVAQGLKALTTNPAIAPACKNWSGPYLKKVSNDPWGSPVLYRSEGDSFQLKSLARDRSDGGDGSDADIVVEGKSN